MRVDLEHVTQVAHNRFVTEASTLRLPVGQVPRELPTSLGNGQPFKLLDVLGHEWVYHQPNNGHFTLTVYND